MSCIICSQKIGRDKDTIQCCACKQIFHVACVGSPTEKKDWKCELCGKGLGALIKHLFSQLFKKLDDRLEAVEKSQNFISDQYDDMKKKLDQIAGLQAKVNDLEIQLEHKNKMIDSLSMRLVNLEQYSRRNNIEIREVNQTDGENIEQIVIKVGEKLNVKLTPSDIETAHRMPTSPGKCPAIIARLVNRKITDLLLSKKRVTITNHEILTDSQTRGNGKIYIGENLCSYNRQLLWAAKQQAKQFSYKYVWWKNGVLVRKSENSKVIKINSHNELNKIE